MSLSHLSRVDLCWSYDDRRKKDMNEEEALILSHIQAAQNEGMCHEYRCMPSTKSPYPHNGFGCVYLETGLMIAATRYLDETSEGENSAAPDGH